MKNFKMIFTTFIFPLMFIGCGPCNPPSSTTVDSPKIELPKEKQELIPKDNKKVINLNENNSLIFNNMQGDNLILEKSNSFNNATNVKSGDILIGKDDKGVNYVKKVESIKEEQQKLLVETKNTTLWDSFSKVDLVGYLKSDSNTLKTQSFGTKENTSNNIPEWEIRETFIPTNKYGQPGNIKITVDSSSSFDSSGSGGWLKFDKFLSDKEIQIGEVIKGKLKIYFNVEFEFSKSNKPNDMNIESLKKLGSFILAPGIKVGNCDFGFLRESIKDEIGGITYENKPEELFKVSRSFKTPIPQILSTLEISPKLSLSFLGEFSGKASFPINVEIDLDSTLDIYLKYQGMTPTYPPIPIFFPDFEKSKSYINNKVIKSEISHNVDLVGSAKLILKLVELNTELKMLDSWGPYIKPTVYLDGVGLLSSHNLESLKFSLGVDLGVSATSGFSEVSLPLIGIKIGKKLELINCDVWKKQLIDPDKTFWKIPINENNRNNINLTIN